jgi:hypothetical protein
METGEGATPVPGDARRAFFLIDVGGRRSRTSLP